MENIAYDYLIKNDVLDRFFDWYAKKYFVFSIFNKNVDLRNNFDIDIQTNCIPAEQGILIKAKNFSLSLPFFYDSAPVTQYGCCKYQFSPEEIEKLIDFKHYIMNLIFVQNLNLTEIPENCFNLNDD